MRTELAISLSVAASVTLLLAIGVRPSYGQTPPPVVSSADESDVIGEIVVTATRQAESISKVPISLTALSSAALDDRGVSTMDDLTRLVPGVSFDKGLGPVTTISIRGIASDSGASTTGVYINDTPIQSRVLGQGGTYSNTYPVLFDLDRVEVLRGPQGTLFGSGSQGGTVRFITPQPSLRDTSVYTKAELSNIDGGDENYEAGFAVGTPIITDTLGARVSAYFRRDGGYIDRTNPLTGAMVDRNSNWQDSSALRAAFTYAPTDWVSITPSIFYQKQFINQKPAIWGYLSDPSDGTYVTGAQTEEPTTDKMTLATVDAHVDLSHWTIYSNTAYMDRRADIFQNFSNFIPAVIGFNIRPGQFIPTYPNFTSQAQDLNTQRSFSQELRAQSSSPDASLRWVVGAFYQRAPQTAIEALPDTTGDYNRFSQALFGVDGVDAFGLPLATSSAFPWSGATQFSFLNRVKSLDEQLAGFIDLGYKLTEKLTVDAGVRVARIRFSYDSFGDGPFAGGLSVASGEQSQKPVTPKFNLSYQLTANDMVYAVASKGFRGGGANAPVSSLCAGQLQSLGYSAAPPSFGSDSVWSYELGSKDAWFERRLRVAASVYMIDWTKIQQQIYLSSCGMEFDANVGAARSKGFDISVEGNPTDTLTLGLAAGYTDARFTETVLGGVTAAGTQTVIVNRGDALDATPWIVSASAEQRFDLFGRRIRGRLDYSFKSARPSNTAEFDTASVSYDPRAYQNPSTSVLNARVSTLVGGVEVAAFVDNLANSHTPLARVSLAPSHNEVDELDLLTPRTIGITLTYRN
jgi:outer membrane receptor protein involved in Fe transport